MRTEWNEERLKDIARRSGVSQTLADVSYGRFVFHHSPSKLFCRWFNGGAFLIAVKNKWAFRIIGIACVKEWQRKGVGSLLLSVAIDEARKCGYKLIETRSKEGAEFYCRKGFDVVGMKGGDYLLNLQL
jgi:GNAT superfamily N-acetyltransferase|uniref:GNAT family N-acetyltransferase n=1 Tax=Prevotella sp. TaxID=59823 RepID=UPI004025BA4F